MTDEELARQIALGIIETGVEGGYDAVSCSTAGDYPSIGVSQWEGIGGRGDLLLSYIDGGDHFSGRTYSDIEVSGELQVLADLLSSNQGQEAQQIILAQDCLELYIPALQEVPGFTNPLCIIYSGIWCPTSHDVVRRFLTNRYDRYDINCLEVLRDIFRDQYWIAASVGEVYAQGYMNRAENTYNYVSGLEV